MKRPLENPIVRFAVSGIIVAAITFVCFRWLHVNYATVGFGFLLAVLFISANWGLRNATFTAILASVAYNYFFLPPLFRFIIADPQNWIALLTFLVTAVVGSQLSERARRSALSAEALIEVKGVRNSWVTESSRTERSLSLSRAASLFVSFSTVLARSIEIATRLLIASRLSRERSQPHTAREPMDRIPMRNGT